MLQSKIKKIMSILTSVCILLSIITTISITVSADSNGATFEYDNYTVDYTINSTYGANQSINVTVTNTGSETIKNWMLSYDDFCGDIIDIWNAVIVETDSGTAYIRNVGSNANIAPNDSIYFGYTLTNFTGIPANMSLCQERVEKQSGFTATLNVVSDWNTSFNGEIILANETDKPIEWWELTFDSNFSITEVTTSWAADCVDNGNCNYTFKGTYTGIVAPNSSVILGFQATKNGEPMIEDISLTEVVYKETLISDNHLTTNTKEILVGTDSDTVYFYLSTLEESANITLYENDVPVAVFYDNGNYATYGDDIQGDGVYSAKYD
ncbi:MAG: cellulose-binding domain-containing protein, partial [Oscillospiraceae bacterium]|nr:cellulose-binding domain-containing protein [Oscillospiraceae bacterium]